MEISEKYRIITEAENEVIVEVFGLLNGIDFNLEDTKSDLLGDAYEYLIG